MTAFSEQAISQQNPFDSEIIFPLEAIPAPTFEDYLDYFQRLENLLTKRNATADTLVLKFASKEAIRALKTYLSQASELRFKELKIEPDKEDEALLELVKLAADKGLSSLNLASTKLSQDAATKILKLVQNSALCMNIVLPDEHLQTQQELDDYISNFQKEKTYRALRETSY